MQSGHSNEFHDAANLGAEKPPTGKSTATDGTAFSVGTAEVTRIGREIALGLSAAHDLRIVHRDIKPVNILLEDGTERVRVTDFGIARAADSTGLTVAGNIVGTPSFISPEQVDNQPLGPASDLFSLGSVLYALCTGRPPFDTKTVHGTLQMVLAGQLPPIPTINPAIPGWLSDFIDHLHEKAPSARFASALSAARTLESLSSRQFHP